MTTAAARRDLAASASSRLWFGAVSLLLGACSSDAPPSTLGGLVPLNSLDGGSAGMPAVGGSAAGATGTVAGTGGSTAGTGMGGAGAGTGGAIAGAGGAIVAGAGGDMAGAGGMAGGGGGAATQCNGAALCDSFERTMLGPDWVLDNTAPTVIELVTNKAHTGANSVHISFGTQTTQSYISESKTFPAMGNAFWGRAWIFSMVPLDGHQIYIEARVAAGSDKTGVRALNTFDKGGNQGVNLESSDASNKSMIPMKAGSWVCYEWQITGIGGTGSFTSWVDGAMVGTLTGAIPKLARQRIGIQRYKAGSAGEMWIDDVAIGEQRITCAP